MTKPKTITGQFVPHRLEMLQSLAWRSLGGTAKCVLDRLEIEHMTRAGKGNGRLICPYNDLIAYGLRRNSIAPAIRELCAAGFLVITQRGRRSAGGGDPAHYRLTYLPTEHSEPTDEWRDARPNRRRIIARTSPNARSQAANPPPKPQIVGIENDTVSAAETIPMSVSKTILPEPNPSAAKTILPSRIYPSSSAVQGTESQAVLPPDAGSGADAAPTTDARPCLARLRAMLLASAFLTPVGAQ